MDIDLLFTPKGESGLLASENFIKKIVGVILDKDSGHLSLEFVDMDHMDLNIPVEAEFFGRLDMSPHMHLGAVKEGKIAQAYQVPLMMLGDPHRAKAFEKVKPPKHPLDSFNYFIKSCVLGQPVHRDDTGNEDTIGCILGDTQPASLAFVPHLARQHMFEATTPTAAPSMGPGMGLGGSSGGGGGYSGSGAPRKYPTDEDEG
ncbi:MAG: hypothetical protein OEY94_08885 [Alphaproteobacteria bacterium]|nr:hypothetical protein [Alphaproteobacteria bacterium]